MFSGDYSSSMGINIRPLLMERASTKWKYNTNAINEIAPPCPRCASSNTKFCYYNNYSLSQPRYFCKGCRRYWTKGGSLRNVPVGGGCRKSRRSRGAGGSRQPAYSDPAAAGSTEASGAGIDMAAVFANYVNHHVENVENDTDNNNCNRNEEVEEEFSPGASSGSFDVDSSQLLEDVTTPYDYQQQMSTWQDMSGQEYVYQDWQQQGLLWAEEGTSLGSLEYNQQQAMVQVEDCGLFTPDNDDSISPDFVSDNWGSFDLSAYDHFY